MASIAASTAGSSACCDDCSSAAPLNWSCIALCPSDCPGNCPECTLSTLQPLPATSTSSQSSQSTNRLHHPCRLCWNACQCRSMASGMAWKKEQVFKRIDTSVKTFRKRHLERDTTIMTHRLQSFQQSASMRSYYLCGTDCRDPRQCVKRGVRSRPVKPHERPSTGQLYKERRDEIRQVIQRANSCVCCGRRTCRRGR